MIFLPNCWLKIRQTLIQQTVIRGHTPLRTFKFIHILAHWSQLQSLTWPLRILFYLKISMDEDLFAWFCHNHNYIAINNRHFLQDKWYINLKKCSYKLYLKILRKRKLNIFYIQASGFTAMFLQKPLPRKFAKEVWDDDPTSTIRMLKIRPFSPVSKLMKKILLTKNEDFFIISA